MTDQSAPRELTMRDVVWRLERIAGNTDTDPRWLAAQAIRALEGWESFAVYADAAPSPQTPVPRATDEADWCDDCKGYTHRDTCPHYTAPVATLWTRLADEMEDVVGHWRQPIGDADGEHWGLYDLMDKEDREALIDHICGWLVHDAPKLYARTMAAQPAAISEAENARLAAISTAALGWLDGDRSVLPEFATQALSDVVGLRKKYETLQAAAPVAQADALENDAQCESRVARLMHAVEGECDGLAINADQAWKILDYVDRETDAAPVAQDVSRLADEAIFLVGFCEGVFGVMVNEDPKRWASTMFEFRKHQERIDAAIAAQADGGAK